MTHTCFEQKKVGKEWIDECQNFINKAAILYIIDHIPDSIAEVCRVKSVAGMQVV